jgi:soluble lytic murein transglycosylase-like protein
MVMPRLHAPAGAGGLELPKPLAPSEAARIKHIFALQRSGMMLAASIETDRLTDQTLLGHILADRFKRATRVTATALSDWLGRYADLPDACAIYALLVGKLSAGAAHPPPPPSATLSSAGVLGRSQQALFGGGLARDALLKGRDKAALRIGRAAWDRSRGTDGQSAYVAGLAAWRLGDAGLASGLLEAASLSTEAGPGLRAAAAFWAARAHLRASDPVAWRHWMLRAAADPQTLHGMLAQSLLSLHPLPALPSPTLAEADMDAVAATPHGRRAFALLQVGEATRADAELRLLWTESQADPPMARAIVLVANAAGMTRLTADLSEAAAGAAALLPVPALRPRGGFRINPALVYAVAWIESNFDTGATSAAGAHGLMQLTQIAAGAVGHTGADLLHDPGTNLKMGQQYLSYLARPEIAGDDLLRVLASYNSGPSALAHWKWADMDDPLMFLETIPADETRRFVLRTLTAMWRYAARFGVSSPSLDAMASGDWPRFSAELPQARGRPPKLSAELTLASVRLH